MATTSRSRGNSIEQVINTIFGSPWLWGTAVTFVFYAALPYLPMEDMKRYFTAHWIEYATTGLFFIGISTLIAKLKRIPGERRALHTDFLTGLKLDEADDSAACARKIGTHFDVVGRKSEDTHLVRRVRGVCDYVVSRRTADGLEGYLTYLAELGSGRLHDGYALIRTITWAVPILGFLGTVIGITMAIANITPDKLEASLPEVTAGLAVAFDTTALSLALSMILVFFTFIIERSEQQTLDDVEDFGVKRILGLFPSANAAQPSPLTMAEQQAAEQLLVRSEGLINWQMELWQNSLETLRERWSGTLSRQQDYLDQALQTGLAGALADHASQLAEVRSEFITAFQSTSLSIGQQLAETRSALIEQQQQGSEQISQTWQQFKSEITQTRDEHARQLALLTQAITAEVGGWQNQLQSSTVAMSEQFHELRSQGEVFLKLSENESELVRLESRLAENLEAVRVAESLEHTLLNLNAAVNLLTTRARGKAA
jgi:hypothetical protein